MDHWYNLLVLFFCDVERWHYPVKGGECGRLDGYADTDCEADEDCTTYEDSLTYQDAGMDEDTDTDKDPSPE